MSLRPFALIALLFLVVGCRHLDKQYAQVIDDLVARKATKADALREFGTPVSTTVDGDKETVVYVPIGKSSRKSVTKVVNGVEHKEETTVASAGKLKVTVVYVGGVVVSGSVAPNR
jgi:hypothetical protein